jgi:hypothetical protein
MPEPSPNEQFQKVLAVADKQLKTNKIQVRFGPVGKMQFTIDGESLKEPLAGLGIDEATFRSVFDAEVGPLLEAIIRNRLDEYIHTAAAYTFQAGGDQKAQERLQVTLRERASLVEKALVNPELQARYLVKVSSKHPRLRSYTWEVAKKLAVPQPTLPYATLSIETIQPETQLGMWSSFPFFPTESVGRVSDCTFDCDEFDLEDLIRNLQEAKAALNRARKGAASE